MTTDYRALCAELANDLQEARDAVSDWAAYASDHFKQKHDLQGDLDRIQRQITRARAALAQPESQGSSDEELGRRFRAWWHNEGSGLLPLPGMDHEEHARRIGEIAWANGAYVARWGRPAIEPVPTTDARPGGLVERVAEALADEFQPSGTWHDEARAAIREVAAWLRAGRMLHAAELLEQETDR
jgi:hypothetical protein